MDIFRARRGTVLSHHFIYTANNNGGKTFLMVQMARYWWEMVVYLLGSMHVMHMQMCLTLTFKSVGLKYV